MDGQGARVVEENLAPGTEHPLDGLIHGVVQRSSPLAGIRQQPIAFGTYIGRVFEVFLDQERPALPTDCRTPDLVDPRGMPVDADRTVELHEGRRLAERRSGLED